jgi:glycosyltransferase involved in cell wall biosynthesis
LSEPSQLVVALDRPLPGSLPVGSGTAVFCIGRCFHPAATVEQLEILVDGERHTPAAFGMPRPDAGTGRALWSGFWGTVPIAPRARPGRIGLELAASLEGGAELRAPMGTIEVVERSPPRAGDAAPERSGPGWIAVCMATFEPDLALFRAQIESLRAQTDKRWICLISDDCSSPAHFVQIEKVVDGDARFAISRSEQRLGFYRNFERALAMIPAEAELVALCDQDDRWHPEKLQVLREALRDAQLVYSDQCLVDAQGRVLRETFWKGRRNNHTNLASMLVANTITGAATLFRRELTEILLPFPDTPGFQFHDHWLGVAALAAGEVAYVDRPLYDYVQHAGAVFGDVSQGRAPSRRGSWRAAYFYGYLSREVQAQTLLVRCVGRLTPAKRRVLRRFVAAASAPRAFAWLALRPVRALAGLTETLGSESELARGIVWRRCIGLRARLRRSPGDAAFPTPDTYNQKRMRRWRARI